MSLITRCPTCETMFKVVPDQLRVSEGWVRCGQCAEIFDATQNMVPAGESESPATPQAATTQTPAVAPNPPQPAPSFFVRPAQSQTTPPPAAASPAAALPTSVHAAATDEPGWIDSPLTEPETVFLGQEPDAESEPRTQPLSQEPADIDLTLPDSVPAPADNPPLRAPQPAQAHAPPVSFLRDSDKPSVWRRPAVRWTLAFVVLVLLALLVVQVVRMERDRIAAVEPATRPLLLALCDITGCDLAPLRQIESIVIESSSFSRVRGDDYRLGFALRNTAPIAIAMPAIELSLTDPQDQAVIRRVIQPAEFAAGAISLAKASVWSGSLALSVKPDAQTERIAGYRLLAFYP